MSFAVLRNKLKNKALYYYHDKVQRKPRKDCSQKCKRYQDINGSIRCGDYSAGWCFSYDKNEGVPYDDKMLKLSDVEVLLVDFEKSCKETEKTHLMIEKKQLVEKYRKLCKTRIQNIADDAVCFFIEELTDSEPEKLLEESTPKKVVLSDGKEMEKALNKQSLGDEK